MVKQNHEWAVPEVFMMDLSVRGLVRISFPHIFFLSGSLLFLLSSISLRWFSSRKQSALRNWKASACGWLELPACWPVRDQEQSQVMWISCRRSRGN